MRFGGREGPTCRVTEPCDSHVGRHGTGAPRARHGRALRSTCWAVTADSGVYTASGLQASRGLSPALPRREGSSLPRQTHLFTAVANKLASRVPRPSCRHAAKSRDGHCNVMSCTHSWIFVNVHSLSFLEPPARFGAVDGVRFVNLSVASLAPLVLVSLWRWRMGDIDQF